MLTLLVPCPPQRSQPRSQHIRQPSNPMRTPTMSAPPTPPAGAYSSPCLPPEWYALFTPPTYPLILGHGSTHPRSTKSTSSTSPPTHGSGSTQRARARKRPSTNGWGLSLEAGALPARTHPLHHLLAPVHLARLSPTLRRPARRWLVRSAHRTQALGLQPTSTTLQRQRLTSTPTPSLPRRNSLLAHYLARGWTA